MFDFKFRTLIELTETLSDEQKCIDLLEQILWNGNPVSPFDPTSHVWKLLPDFLQHIETVQIYIMHGHDLSLP